jgi:hypothetical protein
VLSMRYVLAAVCLGLGAWLVYRQVGFTKADPTTVEQWKALLKDARPKFRVRFP